MSKPIFYEGQEVGCLMYGEGVVKTIVNRKLRVELDKFVFEYHFDGRISAGVIPTLYPIQQYRTIIANLPAPEPEKWQPKPGEWCWFWNNYNSNAAVIAKFVQVLGTKYMAEISGDLVDYPNCAPFIGELPEHLKEVQP